MANILYSSNYNFSPSNSGEDNRKSLQKLLDIGGHIIIDEKGTYDICGTLFIGDNTTLEFSPETYVRRIPTGDGDGCLLINKGALNREYNHDIKISGMHLICNNVEITKQTITGMYCHIGLFYTKRTIIDNLECYDLGPHGFCIQICTFEDSLVENIHVEGMKDAVHYGPGKRFQLRNGVFRTYDDPIALNANDYAIANPQMGWIEYGLIENCCELDQPSTTGFFCRLLGGSWVDWTDGIIIRNSDTVVSNGRLYRAKMPPDGKEYISHTQPLFEDGEQVLDGITWVMIQDDNPIYNCGCRFIQFKDIYLKKNRPTAFAFHFDNDVYSHSYYPYSKAPVQEYISFENVNVLADVKYFIYSTTPIDNIKITNSTIKNANIRLAHRGVDGINYPTSKIYIEDCKIQGDCTISAVEGRKIVTYESSNQFIDNSKFVYDGNVIKNTIVEK